MVEPKFDLLDRPDVEFSPLTRGSTALTPIRLRILLLGWNIGRGSTGVFIEELARYLCSRGHSVTCLSAGVCDWRLRPHLRVVQATPYEVIELRNPPVMFGARPNDPLRHVDSPETVALLRRVLRRAHPAVAGIIDYPGWPANTVQVCQEAGSRALVYLQNFWPVCTRLSLFSRWKDVCYDYHDGERCAECMADLIGSDAARWRSRLPAQFLEVEKLHFFGKKLYRWLIDRHRNAPTSTTGGAYAVRRRAYVEAINKADLLVGISGGSLRTAARFGINTTAARELPVRYVSQARLRRARRPEPAESSRVGPLHFAYLGAVVPEKGAEILVSAFRGFPADCVRLDVYGAVSGAYRRYLESLSDAANPPIFHGRYDRASLAELLIHVDLGIVPSNCEDTLPSTVTEFHALGIPVIGSRIGGIPNQIADGDNGLLFEPGDVRALTVALQLVTERPHLLENWRSNLPSSFDPAPCWMEFERYCYELIAST